METDVIIVGAGLIGLATARALHASHPDLQTVIVDKEAGPGQHQSGRNSGVLHTGIYYPPGSQKAALCMAGRLAMETFCEEAGVPFRRTGKVIVATTPAELQALEDILRRGQANGVRCERIGVERLGELEPHAAGVGAIHVPDAGVVDFAVVCARLAARLEEAGVELVFNARVQAIDESQGRVTVNTTAGPIAGSLVANCAGLASDRVARLGGQQPPARIVPFRGEYFALAPAARHLCRTLIYPVPDPRLPFLGVHFTRHIDGRVTCGPNAVLAAAREGYRKRDVAIRDIVETATYAGFRRMAVNYWRAGVGELWRSLSKDAFVGALQRLVPEVRSQDLTAAPAGVRAQAVFPSGELAQDFVIQESPRAVHVVNAPSPAATASLAIGRHVATRLAAHL